MTQFPMEIKCDNWDWVGSPHMQWELQPTSLKHF